MNLLPVSRHWSFCPGACRRPSGVAENSLGGEDVAERGQEGVLSQLVAYHISRPHGRIGFDEGTAHIADSLVKQDHLAGRVDGAITEHFNCVLHFVADGRHEIPIRRSRFDQNPK